MDDIELVKASENLNEILTTAKYLIGNEYAAELEHMEIIPVSNKIKSIEMKECTWLFRIDQFVYSQNEEVQEKLSTVTNAIYLSGATAVLLIHNREGRVSFYIGVVNKGMGSDLATMKSVLQSGLEGNFPGSKLSELSIRDVDEKMEDFFGDDFETQCITAISGAASSRFERADMKKYVQGIENMIDSLGDASFTLALIADPVSPQQIQMAQEGYQQLGSQLSSYEKIQLTLQSGSSISVNESETKGITESISNSIALTQTYSKSNGWSEGTSETDGTTKQTAKGVAAGVIGMGIVAATTLATGPAGGFIMSTAYSAASSLVGSKSRQVGNSYGNSHNQTDSSGETKSEGIQKGNSFQTGYSQGTSTNEGKSIQFSHENYTVKSMLQKIERYMKWIDECENYGVFNCCTYVISSNAGTNTLVANHYQSLMRGENSGLQMTGINTWADGARTDIVKDYISHLTHPVFQLNKSYGTITPAVMVGSKELAIQFAFPRKSIKGLPVLEYASFGRNIVRKGQKSVGKMIKLGDTYHMGRVEKGRTVHLDVNSLASHTFVTGTNGSGKSNTIYKMIEETLQKEINFLVIEPAKGEYKHVFGNRPDVNVYGTNPYKTELLKINPFQFNEDVHVLEHIDKLIEIFNACWPMYAAMPAVLKEAVEHAYISVGWDLEYSVCEEKYIIFPSFKDVLEQLELVIERSTFSGEAKSNYSGALTTRIASLCNGIFGSIFSSEDLGDRELFEKNVIIDLSRVGSIETKAMIMGIIILRLQEFRMSQSGMNLELKHLTVLEEAHHLLRRTSMNQSSDGANLLGKSVEMISNSIAEMRTYGEGFIIVDQSPGLLDISVIRNTNTKLIFRLPEISDRELAGKSISLNNSQIEELSKLETGVGVVYQNNWQEAILCKVDKAACNVLSTYQYKHSTNGKFKPDMKLFMETLLAPMKDNQLSRKLSDETKMKNLQFINDVKQSGRWKKLANYEVQNEQLSKENAAWLVYELFQPQSAFEKAKYSKDIWEWNKIMMDSIKLNDFNLKWSCKIAAIECILHVKKKQNPEFEAFYHNWCNIVKRDQ